MCKNNTQKRAFDNKKKHTNTHRGKNKAFKNSSMNQKLNWQKHTHRHTQAHKSMGIDRAVFVLNIRLLLLCTTPPASFVNGSRFITCTTSRYRVYGQTTLLYTYGCSHTRTHSYISTFINLYIILIHNVVFGWVCFFFCM